MLDPLYEAIGWLLALFYSAVPNLGFSIVLLTFTIMLLLYPLTAKQARSMIRMQMVQPEIKRIQAKYKNDRAKLNEEMMRFYQENKINPLAGCLPLLVQMPIFFALFRVLHDSYKYVPVDSKLFEALCTTKAGVVTTVSQCAPGGRYPGLPVHEEFLGVDLSVSAPNQVGTWASIAAFAMVILVMLTGYMQSRQAQKRTPAVNKQMALVTKVLPVFFGFISLNFPAGLVLYFFVSNLWRLGQQEVIFRRFGTAAAPRHRSLLRPLTRPATEAGPATDETPPAGGATGTAARAAVEKRARGGARSIREPAPAKPLAPPARAGGLRGLFQLPPPPEAPPKPGAGATSGASAPAAAPTGAAGARPGQAGRRKQRKKRKR